MDPAPLFEAYLCVWPDGRATLAPAKLDTYTPEGLDVITQAVLDAFTEWMRQSVGRGPNAILGDGGPDVVRLRARIYELLAAQAPR